MRATALMRSMGAVACLVLLSACGVPRDPEGTLASIRSRGEIRVGVTEAPPWIERNATSRDAEPAGIEAELIRELAARERVKVRWIWGSLEEHYAALERFELDLVAGGITHETPWSKRIGMTRPFFEHRADERKVKHVLATPPGENAWLAIVEMHLQAQRDRVAAMVGRTP